MTFHDVRPEDFGAIGDGTPADTRRIQSAVNEAQTTGRKLRFSTGTWLLYTSLHIRGKIHIEIPAGVTIKFDDAAIIDDTSDHHENAQNPGADSYDFAMFQFVGSVCDGSVVECYGKLDGNAETIRTNTLPLGSGMSPLGFFLDDCDNILIKGNWQQDNLRQGVWMATCNDCVLDGVWTTGNSVAITTGETGAVCVFESCNNCVAKNISVRISDQTLSEVVDFNGGNYKCRVESVWVEGLTGSSDECFDVNGGGGNVLRDIMVLNCRKAINVTGTINPNIFGSSGTQHLESKQHVIDNVTIFIDASQTFTFDEPTVDCSGSNGEFIECSNLRISIETDSGITITAPFLAEVSIGNGTANGIYISSGDNVIWDDMLNLIVGRATVNVVNVTGVLGDGDSMLTIDAQSFSSTLNEVTVRQNSGSTTTNRTGVNFAAGAVDITVVGLIAETVAEFATWGATEQNRFLAGDTLQGNIPIQTDATRGGAGRQKVIFNTDDGNLNIADGTNWILPNGTTT